MVPRPVDLRSALDRAQPVGVKDTVLEVHKGRYAGDDRERLVGVPAARAGAAPSADFGAHRAGAARADEEVLVDHRVEASSVTAV